MNPSDKKYNIAIIGASGYTASELIRLVHGHPNIEIKYLVGNTEVDNTIDNIYPYLKFKNLPTIICLDKVDFHKIDLIFCCLPHGETAKIITKIPDNIKIIDLSSDYRISDNKLYNTFYNTNTTQEPQTTKVDKLIDGTVPTKTSSINRTYQNNKAVYGLSEIYADQIKKGHIIACPGCFPTSILLPLIPLIKHNLISKEAIIIDSKTGISGAGRKSNRESLFCEINENLIPYNITQHRHLAEIYEQLEINSENIQFTPQIIPASRGIMSVIYANSSNNIKQIRDSITDYYKEKIFIKINNNETTPMLRNVIGTNFCEISIIKSNIPNQIIIFSAIDNLTKGSSGQAIQNFNLINDLAEDTGLKNLSTFP